MTCWFVIDCVGLLRYPGGKTRLLACVRPYLDALLVVADVFVDAFVGGASVALDVAKRHPSIHLILNDKDEGIADLWRVMVGPAAGREALKRLVREATPTVALRDELKARYGRPAAPVERAFEALFINRTSYSGNATGGPLGGRHQTGKTKIGDRWNPVSICREIDRAHALLAGRCEVLSEDASHLFDGLVGQDRTFAYADPPYFRVGNTLYRVGMTPLEHARLAERLRALPNWVLSYDDAPEIRALYHWAVAMPLVARYSIAKANGTRKVRRELLILPPTHPIVASAAAARRAA